MNQLTDREKLAALGYDSSKHFCKRGQRISHKQFSMCLACLVALRSPDPSTKTGACIINNNKQIIGVGYNTFPEIGVRTDTMDFELPLEREGDSKLNTKYPYVCHAAANSILNKNLASLDDCEMYTTHLPCNECFKLIIQSGIKKVYFLIHSKENWIESQKRRVTASEIMSIICDVKLEKFEMEEQQPIVFRHFVPPDLDEDVATAVVSSSSYVIPEELVALGFHPDPNGIKPKILLNADDYFMSVAILLSRRSKDSNENDKNGACVVDENGRIVSFGYTGFPRGSQNKLSGERKADELSEASINDKRMYVCHAALNAIVNKCDSSITNCKMYSTVFPCNFCAQLIVQSRIKEVIYLDGSKLYLDEYKASMVLFRKAGVLVREHKPKIATIPLTIFDDQATTRNQ